MNATQRKAILRRVSNTLKRRDKIMTDVNVEENAEVTRDSEGYIVDSDTLSFTVPAETVKSEYQPGDKYEKTFTFRVVENEEQAHKLMEAKGWDLVELVNRKTKADARSNAYQSELLAHKPLTSSVSVDQIKERMVRDAMRGSQGRMSEAQARAFVESMFAQNNG